ILVALERITLSSAPDYLDGALSEVVSGAQYGRAFVVSDKQASFTGPNENRFPVDARTVGDPVPNIALVNLRLERKKESGNTVAPSVAYFGSNPVPAKLRAESRSQVLAETSVELQPKRIVEARLTLSRSFGETLRIEVMPVPGERGGDALPLDNAGYI